MRPDPRFAGRSAIEQHRQRRVDSFTRFDDAVRFLSHGEVMLYEDIQSGPAAFK
jgi:hypothetical protein